MLRFDICRSETLLAVVFALKADNVYIVSFFKNISGIILSVLDRVIIGTIFPFILNIPEPCTKNKYVWSGLYSVLSCKGWFIRG